MRAMEAGRLQVTLGVDRHLGHRHRSDPRAAPASRVVGKRLGQHGTTHRGDRPRCRARRRRVERLMAHVQATSAMATSGASRRMVRRRSANTHRRSRAHPRRLVPSGDLAQVEASRSGAAWHVRLRRARLGEFDRMSFGGDGDQADGARFAHRADALEHARATTARRRWPRSTRCRRHGAVPVAGLTSKLPELPVGRGHRAHAVPAVGLS